MDEIPDFRPDPTPSPTPEESEMKKSVMVSIRFLPADLEALKAVVGDGSLSGYIRSKALAEAKVWSDKAILCEWRGTYHAPATGYCHDNGYDHPLCDEHLRPEVHPPDLHEHLHRNARPKKLCNHAHEVTRV